MATKQDTQTKRTNILRAAEEVIRTHGAAHLTLDAVARASGYSKGGLTHHFPSKKALISAMIERELGILDDARRENEQKYANQPNPALCSAIAANEIPDSERMNIRRALLAGAIEDPEMLTSGHLHISDTLQRIQHADADPIRALILFLASEAPDLLEILGVYKFPQAQRDALRDRLLQIAQTGEI